MIEATAWQAAESLFLDKVDRLKVLPWTRRAAMRRPDTILTGPGSPSVPYAYHLEPLQLREREHPAYAPEVRDAFFLDEDCGELICRTYREKGAEPWRYVVVDHADQPIGTIERIPRRNAFSRHGWRLLQPGRPELLAEDPPLARRLLNAAPARALEIAITAPVEALLGGGGEGSDAGGSRPRELEWWTRPAGEPAAEKALTMLRRDREDRPHPWRVWVPWLDRRLVLAQMLIPDR